ncbi:peptidoglycan D,D-transpeptidase FtsI family protein [Lysobacter soyae]|uniref:Peptidoglycan D,D-transpeptidase FtsI n=1 Tax=Lysobacter soyae TaxID=2764185 RepID=A0ABX8WP10_9GAMM|nr:penicillin-binding protein 2 [Lysobacter sp. CJ11]QYR52683.1 penicillin-binding protein 2 [Lysobacter sp. CJ11]
MNFRSNRGNNNRGNGAPRVARSRYDVRKRLMIVGGLLGLSSFALLAFAVDRQIIHSDFYRKEGNERYQRDVEIPTNRGMITDRHGEPLAVSTPVMSLWVNPQDIANNPREIDRLADALQYPRAEMARMISEKSKKEFLWLRRRINPAAAQKVLALRIPGVYGQREFKRFYPQGEAIAHVLGFTNIDDHGQEGMELAFDEWLSGKPGKQRVLRDRRGRAVESVDLLKAAEPGKDLALSIDRRIQYLTYRELNKAVEESGAISGTAVVLDIRTGEVLAMANVPSFNPNAVSGSKQDAHRNRAVTDLFEPGSTIKPLTVAAALEAGKITPNTLWNTSPGWIANGRYQTKDTHNYGTLTTTGLITKSSNVGMSLVVRRLSDRQFYDFIRKMGYGQRTNSGFPGEGAGILADPSRWDGTQKQTMSYGYSLSVTPLQVARAYATLANNGTAHTPTFLKGGSDEGKEVLSPKVAHEVMKMMQTVTEPGGTATQASILGYHVAGKTGTARIASGGGYSRRYFAFFAGVAPVDNPRFSMVVVLNSPDASKKGYYGGTVSAPVFRNVIEGALRLDDVPPDDLQSWLAANSKTKAPAAAAKVVTP